MKAVAILSLASLALGSVIEQRACAGNNCNRQVTGTRAGLLPLESRSADCSAFQKVVVTGTARTETEVVWETEAAECDADLAEREVVEVRQVAAPEPTIPAYASSCRDDAAYASACECFGIAPWTSTTRPPVSTETITLSATDCEAYATSTMPACASACWSSAAEDAGCAVGDLDCQCNWTSFSVMAWAIATCLPEYCPHVVGYAVHDAAYNACGCNAATATPTPTP